MTKVWIIITIFLVILSALEVLHIRANFFKRPFKEGTKDYIDRLVNEIEVKNIKYDNVL